MDYSDKKFYRAQKEHVIFHYIVKKDNLWNNYLEQFILLLFRKTQINKLFKRKQKIRFAS